MPQEHMDRQTHTGQNILQNKSQCLSKFKKVKIIPSIFPNHNGIELEIYTRRRAGNVPKYMGIKKHAHEKQMDCEAIKNKIKNSLKQMKIAQHIKTHGMLQRQF